MQIIARQLIVIIGLSAILILSIAGAYAGHHQNNHGISTSANRGDYTKVF